MNKLLQGLPEKERKVLGEFLEEIKMGEKDPVYFAEHILGIHLHEGQKLWLWVTTQTQKEKAWRVGRRLNNWKSRAWFDLMWAIRKLKNILVPGNRFGKTFVTGVKHLYYNYYKIGAGGNSETIKKAQYQTLNLASHSEQANAMPKMMKRILRSELVFLWEGKWVTNKCKIPDFLPEDGIAESPIWRFKFSNGATFLSRTSGDDRAGAIQGAFQNYISYDECCRSHKLEEEIEPDILPRLYDMSGPLDLLSTPDKDSPSLQYYYELCEMGKEGEMGWYTQEGKTTDNIFIAEKSHQLGQESITDPETRKQVISGSFVFSGGRMFSGFAIKEMWDKEMIWEKLPITLLAVNDVFGRVPVMDHKYESGWDFARSESGDATVGFILDRTTLPYEIVCAYRVQGIPITTQLQDLKTLKNYYNARAVIDSNGLGGKIIEELLASVKPIGFDFKATEKGEMLFLLKKAIDERKIKAPIPTLENTLHYLRRELGAYKEEDKKLQTDSVMSLGMTIYIVDRVPPTRIRPIKMFRRL